jgi:hypothetical protein
MKAALYFDDIEGFGEWADPVVHSSPERSTTCQRADGAMFRIVMKKIK